MSRKAITRGYSFNATIRYFEADGTTPINLPAGGNTKFAVTLTARAEQEFDVTVSGHEATIALTPSQTQTLTRGIGTAYLNLTIGDDRYKRGQFAVRVI